MPVVFSNSSTCRCLHIALLYLKPWRPTFAQLCVLDVASLQKLHALAEAPERRAGHADSDEDYVTLKVGEEGNLPKLWPHMEFVQSLDLVSSWQVRIGELSQRECPFPYSDGQVRVKWVSLASAVWRGTAQEMLAVRPGARPVNPDVRAEEDRVPDDLSEPEAEEEDDPCDLPADVVDFLCLQADGGGAGIQSNSSTSSSTSTSSREGSSQSSSSSTGSESESCDQDVALAPGQANAEADAARRQEAQAAVGAPRQVRPESGPWGPWFYMTVRRGAQPDSGAWQALCKWHEPVGCAKCTKSLSFKTAIESETVRKRLKLWLLQAPQHASKAEHTMGRRGLEPACAADMALSDAELDARMNALAQRRH